MPWSESPRRGGTVRVVLVATVVLLLLSNAPSADEKQLSIYGSQVSYAIPVLERNGQDYVGLLEALEPLGTVSAKADDGKWRLRFNNVEAEFRQNTNLGKVAGQKFGLPAPFALENNRGLVPLRALPGILNLILGSKPDYHESARRLFLGGAGTQFTTDLHENGMTVNFAAPVNPMISTEPGKLKMTFTRDPVVSGLYIQRFENPLISSVSFTESNGRAELTIQGHVPLLANFAAGGKTIEILAAPAPAAQAPLTPGAAPAAGVAIPPPPTLSSLLAKPPFVVMLDPAHGGNDRGAQLSDTLQEKDVTLAFARKLRSELLAHGIAAMMTRDADVTLDLDQRAVLADAGRIAVYVSIHAVSLGRGVRVYTSLIQSASLRPGFVSWDAAQAGYVLSSRTVADLVKAELDKHEIPSTELPAPVRPLNNVAAAAIAVEVAPSGPDVASVTATVYQQRVAAAVAEAITVGRGKVEAAR